MELLVIHSICSSTRREKKGLLFDFMPMRTHMRTYRDGTLSVREEEHVYPERADPAATADD